MRPVFLAALLLAACASTVPTPSPSPKTSPTPSATATATAKPSPSAAACTGSPTAHVYNPDRLKLIAACVTVSGTIELVRLEPDGDDHIRLRVDSGQSCAGQPCTNARNTAAQRGDLVLEPVCENPVTQPDAVTACTGYHNPLMVPPAGTRVRVSGPFVLDMSPNHGWLEIHPLEALTRL